MLVNAEERTEAGPCDENVFGAALTGRRRRSRTRRLDQRRAEKEEQRAGKRTAKRRTGVPPGFRVRRSTVSGVFGRGTPCAPKRQARRLSYLIGSTFSFRKKASIERLD